MKNLLITDKDWEAVTDAIQLLRSRIQSSETEDAVNKERSALAGLLSISPKPEPTWIERDHLRDGR